MNRTLDWKKYLETAAAAVAEGIVMLKNNNSALPLDMDNTVAIFGRIQLNYYKSGTGSGGMVNVPHVVNIVKGLMDAGVKIDQELLDTYKSWTEKNPFDQGKGWGAEPWSQKEMPLDEEIVRKAAEKGSTAIVIIGRTAGEEQDASLTPGSFLLTDGEKDMLTKVRSAFEKMIVLLNVGGLIDLQFIESCDPDALLYVWQGGMVGGTGTADVLTGKVSPSGKLPDTIALSVEDYPSHKYFGRRDSNSYVEDIYVGYRYFDTFAPEKIRYPFGFGLSYTTFDIAADDSTLLFDENGESLGIRLSVTVTNTGNYSGKEVVMLYAKLPQGKLGQPEKILCGFEKTNLLAPNESQKIEISAMLDAIAPYDDSGVTGHKNCFVLEKGTYTFIVGNSPVSASIDVGETRIVKQCSQALAPVKPFDRLRPVPSGDGFVPELEPVPLSEVDEAARRLQGLPEELEYTGDMGIKLSDVYSGANTMEQFIAQLSDEELSCIIRGEGMGSPRVTAGTASAFGGVADCLTKYGIPAGCCADGPSGIRMDCGTIAFSLPNGTMIASTFNRELIEKLFEMLGQELAANNVDCLLGPGMNIHRHPLNGRNFEYFSEDPYLTGTMAATELRGLHKSGVTGTIKHFCANNQETNRHFLESAVSERALREIYLKGFEIVVKEGEADSIMTTYGVVNGVWTAGSYDLNTTILRKEWGFEGFTMTDWWANINRRGGEPDKSDFAAMAIAQNDVYMVCASGENNDDNTLSSLASGDLKRCELQRNAANICRFLLHTNAFLRTIGKADTVEIINRAGGDDSSEKDVVFYDLEKRLSIDLSGVKSQKGENYSFALTVHDPGWYKITLTASSDHGELAQIPVTLFAMGTASGTLTWNGTGGEAVSKTVNIPMYSRFTAFRIYFAQNGLDLISIEFELTDKPVSIDKLGEECN